MYEVLIRLITILGTEWGVLRADPRQTDCCHPCWVRFDCGCCVRFEEATLGGSLRSPVTLQAYYRVRKSRECMYSGFFDVFLQPPYHKVSETLSLFEKSLNFSEKPSQKKPWVFFSLKQSLIKIKKHEPTIVPLCKGSSDEEFDDIGKNSAFGG